MVYLSPTSGKKYYTPSVSDSIKPVLGMLFVSVDQAFSFYERYATASGFEVRRSTSSSSSNGLLRLKYFVCAKEGFKDGVVFDTLDDEDDGKVRRRKPSKRVGCGAHIKLRITDCKKYEVYVFEEKHNHSFVAKEDVQFMSSTRRVGYLNESAIQALSSINMGPCIAFNVMKSLCGSFEDVGATKTDFKNYKRDFNKFIADNDAELAIQRLKNKQKHLPNFSCEYFVKEDGTLGAMFWADEYMKTSYFTFGDVVAFDATYRSNKYV